MDHHWAMSSTKNKTKETPRWVENLRNLMDARQMNPRSLSLKAGLNATAVRDMLEGRARFPRYDTVEALADALEIAPAELMGSTDILSAAPANDVLQDDDFNLLTEIIARLQETARERRQQLEPRHFAAMVTSIYKNFRPEPSSAKKKNTSLHQTINQLMAYESLRRTKNKT